MPPDSDQATEHKAAQPTFGFNGFHIEQLTFEEVEQTKPEEGEERPQEIKQTVQLSGGLQMNSEAGRAELRLALDVTPDLKWRPYRIKVVIVGRFSLTRGTAEQFDEFCRMGAPSILFPYVREVIHRTTMDGRYGVVRLNPLNIQAALTWQQATPTGQ